MSDWLPRKRGKILAMSAVWLEVLKDKAAPWGVPSQTVEQLREAHTEAEAMYALADSPERTVVVTAACRDAFAALISRMRWIKLRYYLSPPLQPGDYASLLLSPHDRVMTPSPVPVIKPFADAAPSGKRQHTVTAINPETGSKKRPDEAKGVVFACRVRSPDAPPSAAEDMPSEHQTGTARTFQYAQRDYGKVADYAAAYSGGPKKRGPWSDVVSLVIA